MTLPLNGSEDNDIIYGGGIKVDEDNTDYVLFREEKMEYTSSDSDESGDNLIGNSGHDVLYGNKGDDFLAGGDATVDANGKFIYSESGDLDSSVDVLVGGDGSDTLFGGKGNDYLVGGNLGGDGSDKIYGNEGNDILIGGNATVDVITDGEGNVLERKVNYDPRSDSDSAIDYLIGGKGSDNDILLGIILYI